MKKFLGAFLFLLVFGGAVFVAGFVPLFVPQGSYGVMVSKTGGVHPKVIEGGGFDWRWERLIPTNAKICAFPSAPHTASKTISGELPSAEAPAAGREQPAFPYTLTIKTAVRLRKDAAPDFVARTGINGAEKLAEYLGDISAEGAERAADSVLAEAIRNPSRTGIPLADMRAIVDALNGSGLFPLAEFESVSVTELKLPDMTRYRLALDRDTARRREAATSNSAADGAQNRSSLEQLEKLGALLENHPALAEALASPDKIAAVLRAISAEPE